MLSIWYLTFTVWLHPLYQFYLGQYWLPVSIAMACSWLSDI